MENPNSLKFFDQSQGMTFNRKCPKCGTPTWVQESIHTCYEGKKYLYNKPEDGNVVGVLFREGVWCHECYQKEVKNELGDS